MAYNLRTESDLKGLWAFELVSIFHLVPVKWGVVGWQGAKQWRCHKDKIKENVLELHKHLQMSNSGGTALVWEKAVLSYQSRQLQVLTPGVSGETWS
jgi:hypothetical protein